MSVKSKRANDAVHAMRKMYDHVVRGDWEAYLVSLAPEYVSLGPDGAAKNREQTVRDWSEGKTVLELAVEPIVAREAGDVVFVLAKYKCIDERHGTTREAEGSMFEIWKPSADGWTCLATHFT